MKINTFDDQIMNEIRAQELQDIFREFHQIITTLSGFRDGLFLTDKEAYTHQYYSVPEDRRSPNIVALHSRIRRASVAMLDAASDSDLAAKSKRYDEQIAAVLPHLPPVTLAREMQWQCRTYEQELRELCGLIEADSLRNAEVTQKTKKHLSIAGVCTIDWCKITPSNQNLLSEQPSADPAPRPSSRDAVGERQPIHPLHRRPTEDEIEAAIATIREAMASIGIEEEQAARMRDEIVRLARGRVDDVYEELTCIPTWKDRPIEDSHLKPHEFIEKYYAREIDNGTLTQADIRKKDHGLYRAYHNWRSRNSDTELGFNFPTKKERNDQLLSGDVDLSQRWLSVARRSADQVTREGIRLYDVSRKRAQR